MHTFYQETPVDALHGARLLHYAPPVPLDDIKLFQGFGLHVQISIEWIPKKLNFAGYQKVWQGEVNFRSLFSQFHQDHLSGSGRHSLSCTMGGYAYAKIKFIGRDSLFLVKLSTMMIPSQITMGANLYDFSWLGWINHHTALWGPSPRPTIRYLPVRPYFLKVPEDCWTLRESMERNHFRIFLSSAMR